MAITVKHTKVSTIPDGDDSSLIRPSDWNDDHTLIGLGTMAEQNANNVAITGGSISGVTIPASNVTGTLQVNQGGTGATTLTGYVKGTGTTAMTASATIPNTDITGLGTASTKDAGVANGVATLDAGGKVPTSQIPLQGDLNYQGTWNATTNTPTLTSSVGTKGYYYVVDVAGSTNLNGITSWNIGDWAIFNGSIWEKVDNTDAVTSVNGQIGTVVLTTTNIAEGTNEYFTQARARTSLSAGTGISYDNTTGVITNSSPSLGGDVVGPASATDNAIARFDTTTGKLIQNSVVTVSDTGGIAGATTITDINYVDFDTAYTTTLGVGQLGWDGNNTLALGMAGGNVVQHIGEDTYLYIKASATITKGQLIMFTGAVGASGVLTGAPSTGVTVPEYIMGIAAENIANNDFGLVQSFGELTGVNTNSFNEGDILYYNSAVTGGLTNVYPSSGIIVTVAAVAKKSSGSGVLSIRLTETQRLTASTGISVSQTNSGATITNTAPDQTVSLTGTGTTTVTGTYPNFTINSADQYSGTVTSVNLTAGTGISVSGGPITSSGSISVTNTAPDQVVSIAGAGTTTVTGTYPSFTVTSNDQYVGTVTSVSGTGSVNGITLSGTVTSSGNLTLGGTLGNIANNQLTNSSITINGSAIALGGSTSVGTVTSVSALTLGTSGTDLSSTVANGTTTPVITLNVPTASATNRGALSAADWTTFNSKANAFTYTTNYIPYGQGTTTPTQSANLTFDGTTQTAPIQRASNGIVTNNKTIGTSFTIPSTDNAMSAGPVTLSAGVTVTVSSGSRWVVL